MPRPAGSGKPKGYKAPPDPTKEAAKARLREIVMQHLDPMTFAQVERAKGVSYMILRHPDGTFARATDVAQIDAACAVGATAFQIFTAEPSTPAYTDLMNRAIGKPAEEVELSTPEGKRLIVGWQD